MLTLNSAVAQVLTGVEVHACTDVTGFGLLGHAREMALASNVTLEIMSDAIQFLPGARDYSCKGAHSAGLKNNREFVESCVKFDGVPDPALEALLYDPQTSGGLLISFLRKPLKQSSPHDRSVTRLEESKRLHRSRWKSYESLDRRLRR